MKGLQIDSAGCPEIPIPAAGHMAGGGGGLPGVPCGAGRAAL